MDRLWTQVTPSAFPWEQDALAFLKDRLPDHEPYRAWANFEFILDGAIGEVDVLVVAPKGLFLVEIKSWSGQLEGDAGTWRNTRPDEVRARSVDNPLLLANRKAKRLKSLLMRQRAFHGLHVPFVTPLVFLAHPELDCRLAPEARNGVHGLDRDESGDLPGQRGGLTGIVKALTSMTAEEYERLGARRIDKPMVKRIAGALEQAGIRPSQRRRQVGDLQLGEMIDEGPGYQDFDATHPRFAHVHRRVRIYGTPDAVGSEQRMRALRAAQREFELLSPLAHPGIVRAIAFHEHELGPAIVFERDPTEIRLDRYLEQSGGTLSLVDRLALVRHLAETVAYAHGRRVFHRALSPRSVLIVGSGTPQQRFCIINWQTGARVSGATLSATVEGTRNVEQFIDEQAAAYLAPEALIQVDADAELLDVFSLGAIAFHVFTNRAPATSLTALLEILQRDHALEVASVLDGAGPNLSMLVRDATAADTAKRIPSLAELLLYLDAVEEEVTAPPIADDGHDEVNLEEAKKGEMLAGFEVQRRLGRGSTAIAFLVSDVDGQQRVLKVAADPERNERIREEGEVLAKLRDRTIIAAHGEPINVGAHAAIMLAFASEGTLAQYLRHDGRLGLETLERWGGDLLAAVSYLEQVGIPHRDIKPENLGIMELGPRRLRQLVLMDFSLARTPVEQIHAGTPPYLDPFLGTPGRMRWDLAADRFAAAMTLHEMAAGTLPTWGDGRGVPRFAEGQVRVDRDALPREIAAPLGDFFERALLRGADERFDTAEDMLRAWQRIFEGVERRAAKETHDPDELARMRETATFDTPLAAVGLSARAANALERMNALTVGQLLAVPPFKLNRLRGVGRATRSELIEVHRDLRGRLGTPKRPFPVPAIVTTIDEPDVQPLDELVAQLLPKRSKRNETAVDAMRRLLGLETLERGGDWVSQTEVGLAVGVTRGRIGQITAKMRERWRRLPALTRMRDELMSQLERLGGVAGSIELERLVAAERGTGDAARDAVLAAAAVRAAVETETALEGSRLTVRRVGSRVLLAGGGESVEERQRAAEYAVRLGAIADELAAADTLPGPSEVAESLRAVHAPEGLQLSQERLVQLAAAASERAAVSARLELYPRGLPVVRALALGRPALLGAKELEVEEIHRRIAARFPAAEQLPARPQLDERLREAGIDLRFDEGRGVYLAPDRTGLTAATSYASSVNRQATASVSQLPAPSDPAVAEAQRFEARLQASMDTGGLLTLMVAQQDFRAACIELRRFAVTHVDLDALIIRRLHAAADDSGVRWDLVLRADQADRASQDWSRLATLVARAMPSIEQELTAIAGTLMLENVGLLARYEQLGLIGLLRGAIMSAGSLRGCWLLVPTDLQADLPLVDGTPVPVLTANEWTRIPRTWLENLHRTDARRSVGAA